ncbi:hypothetical protein FRC01_001549 [Tulasnella sp. 417]|nr:hypothetical protein FRC01_001549 [Tulasnella sp. 417]
MEETRDHAADPSHASVILHSSKLRKKLDKLAQWRIDPAIIEFSQDAREFRGGFATVLQALLASPYRGVDHAKERSSKAPNFQLDDDTQESGDGDQGKEGGEDALATDGGNDHIQAERRAVDETTDDQVSMPIVGETLAPPDDPKRKGPDLGNLNLESLGEALEPEDGREDEDDEINGHVTSADTGRGRERETGVSERIHEERNHGPQASKPK